MASFNITSRAAHPTKFACLVEFNLKAARYHEVDSLDPVKINAILLEVATVLETKDAAPVDAGAALELINGKVKE